jgi:hypothetical protein
VIIQEGRGCLTLLRHANAPKKVRRQPDFSTNKKTILLALRQAVTTFVAPHVKHLHGSNFKIAAKAGIKAQDILLVQGLIVKRFEAGIKQVYQVGIF